MVALDWTAADLQAWEEEQRKKKEEEERLRKEAEAEAARLQAAEEAQANGTSTPVYGSPTLAPAKAYTPPVAPVAVGLSSVAVQAAATQAAPQPAQEAAGIVPASATAALPEQGGTYESQGTPQDARPADYEQMIYAQRQEPEFGSSAQAQNTTTGEWVTNAAQQEPPKKRGGLLGVLEEAGGAFADAAGKVGNIPLAPALSSVPQLNTALNVANALIPGKDVTTVGDAAKTGYETYMNDIPVVSPFMRNTVAPAAGEVGEFIGAQAYDRATNTLPFVPRNLQPANVASGLLGIDPRGAAGATGEAVAESLTPVSAGDIALSLLLPATADWADIARVAKSSGLLDELGRATARNAPQVQRIATRLGMSADEAVVALQKAFQLPGGGSSFGATFGPTGAGDNAARQTMQNLDTVAKADAVATVSRGVPLSQLPDAPPAGYVRLYRGEAPYKVGAVPIVDTATETMAPGRWWTADLWSAQGYAKRRGGDVVGIDVPRADFASGKWTAANESTVTGRAIGLGDNANGMYLAPQELAQPPTTPSFPRLADESDIEYAVRLRTSGFAPADIKAIEKANAQKVGTQIAQEQADRSTMYQKVGHDTKQVKQRATKISDMMDKIKAAAADETGAARLPDRPTQFGMNIGLPSRGTDPVVQALRNVMKGAADVPPSAVPPPPLVPRTGPLTAIEKAADYAKTYDTARVKLGKEALLPDVTPGSIRATVAGKVKTGDQMLLIDPTTGKVPSIFQDPARSTLVGQVRQAMSSAADEATALVGLPRTLKASFDLSAPGRQGLVLAFRHPKEWGEAWAPMLSAWKSSEGAQAAQKTVDNLLAPWKTKYGDDVIHLYQTGAEAPGLSRVPDFEPAGKGVIGSAIRKIPGLEKSERSYATFINVQKAKTFDNMAKALERSGETDPKVFQNLGNIIDHATGFGAAPLKGRFEGQAFFSQRYMTSRFQTITDPIVEGLLKGDFQTARAATENLVAFTGGMAGILALIDQSGVADVNFDPRSSDFGKIRVGPQRIDFGAGFLPMIRTAARVATGEAKSVGGAVYDIDEKDAVLSFFRNKLAPIPSELITRWTGENAIGEPPAKIASPEFLRQMFMPLLADAVLETFNETGDPLRAALAAGSEVVGGGTSAYGSAQIAQNELAQDDFGSEYDSLLADQQAEINARIANDGGKIEYRDRSGAWWAARDDAMSRWQADLGADLKEDPFVLHALSLDSAADIEESMVAWARKTYNLTRVDADAAVSRFLSKTKLDDYVKAYRKGVLAADPGFLESWDVAYEKGDVEYAPPKWAREFVEGQQKKEPVNATP